jgi:hypothetical protein
MTHHNDTRNNDIQHNCIAHNGMIMTLIKMKLDIRTFFTWIHIIIDLKATLSITIFIIIQYQHGV